MSNEFARRRCAELSVTKSGKTMFTFRGSSFAGCVHGHIASLRGLKEGEVPGHMQAIFDRGHAAEAWAKDELERKGVVWLEKECGLANQQQMGQGLSLFKDLPDGRLIRLAITPDGLAIGKNKRKLAAECKSFSKKSYQEFLRDGLLGNERYAYQFSAEIHGYRRRDRDNSIGGVIIPVIAENVQGWQPGDEGPRWNFELGEMLVFEQPPFSLDEVMGRCIRIVDAYDRNEWPKCDSKYPCRWPHEAPPVSTPEIEAIIARYEAALCEVSLAQIELESAVTGLEMIDGRRIHRIATQYIQLVGER